MHCLAVLALGVVIASLVLSLVLSPQKAFASTPIPITGGSIHIQSDNIASSTLASSTSKIGIYFNTASPITLSAATSTIRIMGGSLASTTISLVAGTTYTYVATTTLTAGQNPSDGPLTFAIFFVSNDYGTTTAYATTDGSSVTLSSVKPHVVGPITIVSNNTNNTALASSTNVVTLTFHTDEAIQAPTVTLGAHAIVAVTSNPTASTTWTATDSSLSGDSQGVITFSIPATDFYGNATTTPATWTTNASSVTYDSVAPTVTPSTITSNNTNTALAKSGNTVVLHFTSNEAILAPTVTIGAHTGITAVDVSASTTWTATAAIDATDSDGTLTFSIATPHDMAGNATTSASWLSSTGVRVDETAPTITLLGSSPVNMYQNATYSDAGATASDSYDGDITSSIVTTNPVNVATPGTYTVTYNVSDAAGNAATQVTRTVIVNGAGGGVSGGGPLSVGYVNSGGGGGWTYQPATIPTDSTGGISTGVASSGSHRFAALTLALKRGMKNGTAVQVLQEMLNQDPSTQVTATGPGSLGNETTFFGAMTEAAVQKFQAKYGIVSSGTPATTGYGAVGPKTRAKLNALYGQQ